MRRTKAERALRDQIDLIDQRIREHRLRIDSIQAAIDEANMLRVQLSSEVKRLCNIQQSKNTSST